MTVTVSEVRTRAQRREFIEFPLRLYKGNPYFVPPIYADERCIFTDKNPGGENCESVFFIATKNGRTVGRIQGVIQKQYNELHGEKRLRFTRFDAIDDAEVAGALFSSLEQWALSHGLDTVCGPLSYNDLEREGLLVEGFDQLSTYAEQYNYEYYQRLIEGLGYEKEVDWLEFRLFAPKNKNPMLKKVAERALELSRLHFVDPAPFTKREYIDKYKDGVFDCIHRCYSHLYGTVPISEEAKAQIIDQFMLVLNKEYLIIICDENERVVSFALCIPSIGEALQKSGGKLTPMTLIKLLRAINKPRSAELCLVAVLPEYQSAGINALMLHKMTETLESGRLDYFETNLNLESNTQVMAQWKYFDAHQHKRRRAYVKSLLPSQDSTT